MESGIPKQKAVMIHGYPWMIHGNRSLTWRKMPTSPAPKEGQIAISRHGMGEIRFHRFAAEVGSTGTKLRVKPSAEISPPHEGMEFHAIHWNNSGFTCLDHFYRVHPPYFLVFCSSNLVCKEPKMAVVVGAVVVAAWAMNATHVGSRHLTGRDSSRLHDIHDIHRGFPS
jgi:hypothetical protein